MAPKKRRFLTTPELSEKDRAYWNLLLSQTLHRAEERWQRLLHDTEFEHSLEKIRKELKIPVLEASSDGYARSASVEDGDADLTESQWLDSLPAKEKQRFADAVRSLLTDFDLTVDFDDRIRYWLLYRRQPRWIPPLGLEHIFHTIEDPSELKRIPLTTAEKKLLLWHFRKRLGIKGGRVPKEYAGAYAWVLGKLAASKNKTRRFRTLKGSVAAFELKGQRFEDNRAELKLQSKKTYLDLVGELAPVERLNDAPKRKDDERTATKLRTQKSRFIKRGKKAKR